MNAKKILVLVLIAVLSVSSLTFVRANPKAIVTFAFDDGTLDQATIAYPLMLQRGIVGTFYIPTGNVKINQIPIQTLKDMQNNGMEIGSHSVTHSDFTTLTDAQIAYECQQSKATLESWGLVNINNLAYPIGIGDLSHVDSIVSQYYRSARTTYWSSIALPCHQFELPAVYGESIGSAYSDLLGNLKQMIYNCNRDGSWTIFYFHDVCTTQDSAIKNGGISVADFTALLDFAKNSGAQILTVNQALNLGSSSTPTPNPSPPTTQPGSQIAAVGASASSSNGAYGPSNAIDGVESASNYWGTAAVSGLPQWLRVDLGSVASINQVVTHFYDGSARTYTYNIDASVDGSSWTPVVSTKTGSGVVTDVFSQVAARYVRVSVSGNSANTAAHVEEIRVFQSTGASVPNPTSSPVQLSGSQIAAVGASASSSNGGYGPSNAIDGVESASNYWGTAAVLGLPQWLRVDLGSVASINQVVTHFYDGSARTYTYNIDASVDGSSWTPVVSTKTGSGVVTDVFSQVAARYVRVSVSGNSANTAAHVEEIRVFQSTGASVPNPTSSPVQLSGSQIAAVGASASSSNGGYGPSNAIDGVESASNYWGTAAVSGLPQWLRVDLGSAASINKVVTHFYDGSTRTYTYYIDVSVDGSSWTRVVSEKTGSGVVTDLFSQVAARYVRVTVTGNTANTAAHIEEIKVYQGT